MSNIDDPFSDEEQLATVPTDYRALLAMTRPLVIAKDTFLSLQGEEISRSDFGISPELDDWRAEFTLRRGEIIRSDKSELGITRDREMAGRKEEAGINPALDVEDAAADLISILPKTDPNLQIKIYLGMS